MGQAGTLASWSSASRRSLPAALANPLPEGVIVELLLREVGLRLHVYANLLGIVRPFLGLEAGGAFQHEGILNRRRLECLHHLLRQVAGERVGYLVLLVDHALQCADIKIHINPKPELQPHVPCDAVAVLGEGWLQHPATCIPEQVCSSSWRNTLVARVLPKRSSNAFMISSMLAKVFLLAAPIFSGVRSSAWRG